MSWKWSGEGQANKMRNAIREGTKRAVWHCRECGRGQVGGKAVIPYVGVIRTCRYCRAERGPL